MRRVGNKYAVWEAEKKIYVSSIQTYFMGIDFSRLEAFHVVLDGGLLEVVGRRLLGLPQLLVHQLQNGGVVTFIKPVRVGHGFYTGEIWKAKEFKQ